MENKFVFQYRGDETKVSKMCNIPYMYFLYESLHTKFDVPSANKLRTRLKKLNLKLIFIDTVKMEWFEISKLFCFLPVRDICTIIWYPFQSYSMVLGYTK